MGPEDDLGREIRALLKERGTMTTAAIAAELQCVPDVAARTLLAMSGVEYMGGFDQQSEWRIAQAGHADAGFR